MGGTVPVKGSRGAPTRLFPGTTFVAKNHAWESYRLITCTSGTSRGEGTGGGKDAGESSKGSEFTMGSGKATYGSGGGGRELVV